MTTWLPNWKKRDWKLKDGGPVKNKHDFIDLDNACQLVDVKWVILIFKYNNIFVIALMQ